MIIIHPWARKLRNGSPNPKCPPVEWWKNLIKLIPYNHKIVQIGQSGEELLVPDYHLDLKIKDLKELARSCDTWISIDSFFQHLAWMEGKKGIVIFSVSDPDIFGHNTNINLLKSRNKLRPHQFQTWEEYPYDSTAFVTPEIVADSLRKLLNNINK